MTKDMNELFPTLISLVNSGTSIEKACVNLNVYSMTLNTYKRLLLRYEI